MNQLSQDIQSMGFDKLSNKELTKIYWLSDEEFSGESIFMAEQTLIQRGIFEQE